MKRFLTALLLVFPLVASAQTEPDAEFERVLVPVYFFGGGSHGAAWWTYLDLLTTGPTFDLGVDVLQGGPSCPALCGCDRKARLDPWQVENVCSQAEHFSGLLLWVPRNVERNDVHINARVTDRSRSADRMGSEMPVVWEDQLHDNPIVLLNVPTNTGYRTALRIYDAYQWTTRFTVRFYDMNGLREGVKQPLHTATLHAQYTVENENRFPLRPAFVMVADLAATYPALAAVESVGIEIEGAHLDSSVVQVRKRFYAMASVTNNTTQEVTIVSPQ